MTASSCARLGDPLSGEQLSDAEFDYLQSLLSLRSGYVLTDEKRYLPLSRLRPLADAVGERSVGGLLRRVQLGGEHDLEAKIVEAMTINETTWFRDGAPFEALKCHVIPSVIERNSKGVKLSIWSAASSTGQELYSTALLVAEQFPHLTDADLHLYGSDINSAVVCQARQALFSEYDVRRGLSENYISRYFVKARSCYQLKDSIRSMASFGVVNLIGQWPVMPRYDVILLRNVLMYFDECTRGRVLERACQALKPHGYLLLGSAESMAGISSGMVPEVVGRSTFFRLSGRT